MTKAEKKAGGKRGRPAGSRNNVSRSVESIRASRMKAINPAASAKTQVLDVFVWGSGSMCELGLGPNAKTKEVKRPRLNPFLKNIVDFAVGGMHTLALDKDNQLWSWGNNDSGVLGRKIQGGDKLKDMDDASDSDDDGDLNEFESTPGKVEFDFPAPVVQLAAGDNISLVLLSNGEVYGWGSFRNNEGYLGFSRKAKIQREPVKIEPLEHIAQIVAGKDHVVALDVNGLVYTWGNGQQGQLARRVLSRDEMQVLEPRAIGIRRVKKIGTGECHSFAITSDDKVLVWGLNQYGQCGLPGVQDGAMIDRPTEIPQLRGKSVVSITGGEHHTLALTSEGDVYVFGRYDMKEIGLEKSQLPLDDCVVDEHGNVRAMPIPMKHPSLTACKAIACGSHHSLAVSKSGIVFSWGFADTYAVGLGNLDDDVETPTNIFNTATKNHDILLLGAGGQFSVSGGIALPEAEADKRLDEFDED